MSELIKISKDYPMKKESNATLLPAQASKLYGCDYCEWKDSGLCPHGFTRGHGVNRKKNTHVNGICNERKNFLLNFYRGRKAHPSYTEWQHDFNRGIAQLQMNADFSDLKRVEEELKDIRESSNLRDKNDRAAFLMYNDLKVQKRDEWFKLFRHITDLDNRQLDREAPKKLEVEHKTSMSLSDLHGLMRGEVVDVDFEEVKKDE